MTKENQGAIGLEHLLNSIQLVEVSEVIRVARIVTGITPSYMNGTKTKYFIKSHSDIIPRKGQEIIVIPTEIKDDVVQALFYPLTEIESRLEKITQQLSGLRTNLVNTDLPHAAIVDIYNELLDLRGYLKKYGNGKGFLVEAGRKQLKKLDGYCKTVFGDAKDLLSLVDAAVEHFEGDCNIFNKPIPAKISREYAEDEIGDVTPQIGESCVLLNPTKTDCKFYRRDLIHYLSREVQVRLISVDKEGITHCDLAIVPQEAAVKYSNYLKTNAEKTSDLEQARELFTKIDALRQYLEGRYEKSQDKFLPKINENYIVIRDKYAILTARENGTLRICSEDEYRELKAYLGYPVELPSGKVTIGGVLTCQFDGRETVVMAFDFLVQKSYPRNNVIIAPFFGPETNKRTAEEILAKKLTQKDKSGIPCVFQLFPAALHQYDEIYLLTLNKFPDNPVPGMSFVKRGIGLGGYYLNRIHKPEFTLPTR